MHFCVRVCVRTWACVHNLDRNTGRRERPALSSPWGMRGTVDFSNLGTHTADRETDLLARASLAALYTYKCIQFINIKSVL